MGRRGKEQSLLATSVLQHHRDRETRLATIRYILRVVATAAVAGTVLLQHQRLLALCCCNSSIPAKITARTVVATAATCIFIASVSVGFVVATTAVICSRCTQQQLAYTVLVQLHPVSSLLQQQELLKQQPLSEPQRHSLNVREQHMVHFTVCIHIY